MSLLKTNSLRRTGRRTSGHVLLESALAFMPFCAIIFGIADFSMVMYINACLSNAVREGVRYGITYSVVYNGTTYATQTAAIRAVVDANSGGWLSTNDTATNAGATYIKVNYYAPTNLSTPVSSNAAGNVLEVKVQGYPWNWMVPLPNYAAGTGLTITVSALDVLQNVPAGTTIPSP